MNPLIKIIFLPIMIVAGLFTAAMIAAINAPFALGHRLRERRYRQSDLHAARVRRAAVLKRILP